MKRFISFIIAIMTSFTLLLSACNLGQEEIPGEENDSEYVYVSMLTDRKFQNGFEVLGLGDPIYGDELEMFEDAKRNPMPKIYFQYGKEGLPKPEWRLAQWASRHSFRDITNSAPGLPEGEINYSFQTLSEGIYKYENTSKYIMVNTNTGEYSLGLKASKIFKAPRTQGQEWPHWFPERDIYKVPNPPAVSSIAKSNGINVRFSVRLDSFEDHMGIAADPGLHSCMCVFYLMIYNRDPRMQAFTDLLWLGMVVFDNRYPLSSLQSFADTGSKASASEKWIYNIPSSEFFDLDGNNLKTGDNQPIFGEWKSVDIDVLGHIYDGFNAAQRAGYMQNSSWENLYVGGMYFGFEIPGTYDIEMSFKDVDVVNLLKKEDVPK